MGVDGGEYSLCRKRGVGFGGHVCRAGFLCETALRDFRVGDAIENGTRQSRAPLRAVARTRGPAERPVSIDFTSLQPAAAMEPMSQDRQQMSAKPFYPPALRPLLSVRSIATTDRRAQGRRGEVCCATPPAHVRYRRDATVRWSACAWSADQPPARAPLPMRRRHIEPARPW